MIELRVLRVSSDIYPDVVGGLGVHVRELSRDQAKLGHKVRVLTSRHDSHASTWQTSDGFEIVRLPAPISVVGNSMPIGLGSYILSHRRRFDIIHAHSHLFYSTNITAALRKTGGPPLVITNHGVKSTSVSRTMNDFFMRSIGRISLESADLVLCYTDNDAKMLRELGIDKERTRIIHNGVDIRKFRPDSDRTKPREIIWMGRMVEGKGLDCLVKTLIILKNESIDFHLTLIGDGPLQKSVRKSLHDLDLSDQVTIVSRVSQEEASNLIQEAAISVLPSISEGMPRFLLESLSCGVPFVATNLPQLVELSKGCGTTLPYGDHIGFANSIIAYLEDTERRIRDGVRGREKIVNNYDWNDTVARIDDAYQDLLAR